MLNDRQAREEQDQRRSPIEIAMSRGSFTRNDNRELGKRKAGSRFHRSMARTSTRCLPARRFSNDWTVEFYGDHWLSSNVRKKQTFRRRVAPFVHCVKDNRDRLFREGRPG